MNKKLIRLTEGDLHRIVKESVNKVLKEMDFKPNPRRRTAKSKQNINDVKIDTNAINGWLYPDHTPQMAKDQLERIAQYGLMNPPSVK